MSATESLHYRLCQEGARWLHKDIKKDRNGKWINYDKIVAVELESFGADHADVWGTSGCDTAIIEVKVSHSDFLRDKNKVCRKNKEDACGNYRYYLTPKGLLKPEELPVNWGLLEYDGGKIIETIRPLFIPTYNSSDLCMLSSIARREGVKNKIYNYRLRKNEKVNESDSLQMRFLQ